MGTLKWITGILGWVSGGPIGGLIGFLLGSAAESGIDAIRQIGSGQQTGQNSTRTYHDTTARRNSFLVSLLVLSSAVIKADGKLLKSELDFVRDFVRRNFGEGSTDEAMRILEGLNGQQIDIYSVGAQIAANMNYSQRLQLFHYLVELADADGEVCRSEKDALEVIAASIRISTSDATSIISMFYNDASSAYSVLEISPDATDDEVKSAYRRMAMKNHPDKVASLGPDVQKAAEEKFRKIQEAYESIKKQRGIN